MESTGGAKETRRLDVLTVVLVIVALAVVVTVIWLGLRCPATSTPEQALAQVVKELVVVITTELKEAVVEVEDVEAKVATVITVQNDLKAPVLHHADSHAPEEGYGSFDVGVNQDQIGLAFGWHIDWPKGALDAGGEGCDLVILTPGWYENLRVLDGRYEIYTVPTTDYDGWVKVLGQQRADEQMDNYDCPAKDFEEIPQWESSFPSPP